MKKIWPDGLTIGAILIAALIVLPVLVILSGLLRPDTETWQHISSHLLPALLGNTALLLMGVALGTATLGISLAWLTSRYEFPGVAVFRWVLVLPLAIPAYVMAFVMTDLLGHTGSLQSTLRALLPGSIELPDIRSIGGAVVVLSLSFYPYVYLLARNAFESQSLSQWEAAQTLGLNNRQRLFRLDLPLARPWIVSGLLLALMETLADFGAVYILGVDTLTTGIYKAWYSLFSLPAAFQLASILILIALALTLFEQQQRRRRRYTVSANDRPLPKTPLSGIKAWLALAFASFIGFLAFVWPVLKLGSWALKGISEEWDWRYLQFVGHSLGLALVSVVVVISLAGVLALREHRAPGRLSRWLISLASLGYGIPGAVLAVAVFVIITRFDQTLTALLPGDQARFLSGTILATILGLSIRFMAVGLTPLASGFRRVSRQQEQTAQTLGVRGLSLIRRVHWPMLNGAVATAALLVFVEVMKEMPITLMTRPFGLNTLSVRIFELTSEGEWVRAALPSLTLVIVGLLPVMILARQRQTL